MRKSQDQLISVSQPDKNGTVTETWFVTCPRCSGSGQYVYTSMGKRVSSVCFKCDGSGKVVKREKIYTPEYRAKLDKANKRAKELKMQKMWEQYGIEQGYVYIAQGNTFEIKEELKLAGFSFNEYIGWFNLEDVDFIDTKRVNFDEYTDKDQNGNIYFVRYLNDYQIAKKEREEKKKKELEETAGKLNYLGEVGETIEMPVKLVKKFSFSSYDYYTESEVIRFGYIFLTDNYEELKWFSNVNKNWLEGENLTIKFIVKGHDCYKGRKQTSIKNVRQLP